MQQLQVNLTIPIPDDSVLVKKVEIEDLRRQELTGVYWTMEDLERRTNRGKVWLRDNVLLPPKFRRVLDVEKGGFVFYPKGRGQTWSFQAAKMGEFLDKNFHRIFG